MIMRNKLNKSTGEGFYLLDKNAFSILAFFCGSVKFVSQQSEFAFFGAVTLVAAPFYFAATEIIYVCRERNSLLRHQPKRACPFEGVLCSLKIVFRVFI